MILLKFVLWLSISLVFYAYAGYAAVIALLARFFPHPSRSDKAYRPMVTTLIAAHNEEDWIEAKIQNCLEQSYPAEFHEVLIISDGSTDNTAQIVRKYANQGIVLLEEKTRTGKMAVVNRAISQAKGEIIVFSDANNLYNPEAIANLVQHFAESKVGCVAGEKQILKTGDAPSSGGEGLYWKYESFLKRCDSAFYSVVGATGEIYAVRRELYQPPPSDSLLDDFMVSMNIARRGYRVLYEPQAISYETGSASLRDEYKRRTRIFCGGYQSIARLPELLNPRFGRLWFTYVSHRFLRWAITPFLLPLILLCNFGLARRSPFYRLLLLAQIGFYGLGLIGLRQLDRTGKCPRPIYVPAYFLFLHFAELVGFKRWLTQRQSGIWERSERAKKSF